MKIFIDHQYRNIYNGEFREWVELNIINPLSKNHEVIISKDENDSQYLLGTNTSSYDIIFITGYEISIFKDISLNVKNTSSNPKIVSLIYETNAEKLLEIFDKDIEFISDVVVNKSRIVFLSNYILSPSKSVSDSLINLYGNYKINSDKFIYLDKSEIPNIEILEENKLIKDKYITITDSINGVGSVLPDIDKILDDINLSENLPDISFIILSEYFPKSLIKKCHSKVKIYKELSEKEKINIYRNSICNIFPSSLDSSLYSIIISMICDSITLMNAKNEIYLNTFGQNCLYYSADENLVEIIRDIMRLNKSVKDDIIDNQLLALKEISVKDNKFEIDNLIRKI